MCSVKRSPSLNDDTLLTTIARFFASVRVLSEGVCCACSFSSSISIRVLSETTADKVTANHHMSRNKHSRTHTHTHASKSARFFSLCFLCRDYETTHTSALPPPRIPPPREKEEEASTHRRDFDDGDVKDGKIESRNRLAFLPSDIYLGETVSETIARKNAVRTRGFSAAAGKLVLHDKRGTV